MKKFFIAGVVAALAACNSNEKSKEETTKMGDTKDQANLNYPYTPGYSSKFEIGDPKNALTILNLYKDWDNNTLDNSKNSWADTDSLYLSDGSLMAGGRDYILAQAKRIRNTMGTVQDKVAGWVSLRSTDKNENWVLVYTNEIKTAADGKKDSTFLQETWRFNKDGKVDLVYQYAQKPFVPQKK